MTCMVVVYMNDTLEILYYHCSPVSLFMKNVLLNNQGFVFWGTSIKKNLSLKAVSFRWDQ